MIWTKQVAPPFTLLILCLFQWLSSVLQSAVGNGLEASEMQIWGPHPRSTEWNTWEWVLQSVLKVFQVTPISVKGLRTTAWRAPGSGAWWAAVYGVTELDGTVSSSGRGILYNRSAKAWPWMQLHDCSKPAAAAKSRQSCSAAISFSNAWKWEAQVKWLSRVWLLATPWAAAYQAPPSMGFSRQEYWSGVPLPSPSKPATQCQTTPRMGYMRLYKPHKTVWMHHFL